MKLRKEIYDQNKMFTDLFAANNMKKLVNTQYTDDVVYMTPGNPEYWGKTGRLQLF